MKRTTLVLNEDCFRKVKKLARKRGSSMSQVVNEFLMEGIKRTESGKKIQRLPQSLPSYRMGEYQVNVASRDALETFLSE